MDTRSLAVSMNTNFASFDLSRHLSPHRSTKLVRRSIPRASASISTPNSETSPSGNAINPEAISVKPVYIPTPPNRELRTPHSGYHFDGTARKFFEGWYFRVSIPEKRESFCFMYSVENPAFRKRLSPLEVGLYGPRFTGVGAQILGASDKYLCQYTEESHNFWGDRHELVLGNTFSAVPGARSPDKEVPPEEFNRRVSEGFQATPFWHQGHICDDCRCMNLRSRGTTNLVPRVEDIRAFERETRRRRQAEEKQAHFERSDTDMENLPQGGNVNGQGADDPPPQGPQHPQRPARAIGTYDRPNIHGHRLGIRAPAVEANNFEIKSGLLNVIENNKYHGLAVEDPFDHLDRFDSYCGLSKTNGVSEDAFKLKLFPFSLGDKARQWEKSLPSDSITTWDDCKRAFLEKFFSTSRTAKLRNEISSFQQKNLEGFSEAWERFKGYQAQCPHHGFSKESLLSTFYRGALPKYRARLDTASNGFFLGRTEEEAEALVDNMVKSDAVYSGDHDRGRRGDDKQTRNEIKALQEKIDTLLADKATQAQVNFIGNPHQEIPPTVNEVEGLEGQEELCFINSNGSWYKKDPNFQYNNYQQKPYSNNQQSGYQQSNYQPQQNPSHSSSAPQESSTNALLKQILESQTRSEKHVGYELKNLHSKIDGSYNELNNKFYNLASSVKNLENQFASMSIPQNRQPGSLPGKPDQNPKEAKAITLRSGKHLPPITLTKDAEKQGEEVAINLDDEVVIVYEKTDDEILEKIVEAKGKGKVGEEKKKTKDGESAAPASENSSVPPPYEPKLPFPGRFKKQLLQKYKALFEKQMSEAQVTMPIIDAFMLIPQYSKFLKDVVAAKKKEMEGMMFLIHECNAIIQRLDVPEKLEDPGCFTLPCALGPMVFEKCLCDLGASVSLMPLSVAKKLGFTQYKKCRLSLVLADRSVKYPVGILENLPVKIGRYEIPTDFVVLEMGEEAQDPLILGRPFLATAGAIVNVKEGKIDLHLGNENILHFDIKEKMRNLTMFGQAFTIEDMGPPADDHLDVLPPEEDGVSTPLSAPTPA